jgi:V8-like Glu-specific endopeptidase
VACYPEWNTESKGIGLVLLPTGTETCSGALLNNTNQDFRPFFLTAFHCIDENCDGEISTAEANAVKNWAFRFHYKKTTCTGNTIYNWITYNYANLRTFRLGWETDVALVELQSTNFSNSGVRFLGWDRSGNTPLSGTGIHHPKGNLMKISFDIKNTMSSNNNPISWRDCTNGGAISPVNTHWVVKYRNGTTEGGSSGSPLFDQNKRVIGQLHGGGAGCPDEPYGTVTKYYGQLHKSWWLIGMWLNPTNSGQLTLDATCPTRINLTNQTITTNQTFTSECKAYIKNVTVSSSAKLTITAADGTTIDGPFEVKLGSQLEVK